MLEPWEDEDTPADAPVGPGLAIPGVGPDHVYHTQLTVAPPERISPFTSRISHRLQIPDPRNSWGSDVLYRDIDYLEIRPWANPRHRLHAVPLGAESWDEDLLAQGELWMDSHFLPDLRQHVDASPDHPASLLTGA